MINSDLLCFEVLEVRPDLRCGVLGSTLCEYPTLNGQMIYPVRFE